MQAIRSYGSCALDMTAVACGRLDISFELCGIRCWDYSASTIIVEEAGGCVIDPMHKGQVDFMKNRYVAAACRPLCEEVYEAVQQRSLPEDLGTIPGWK